MTSTADRYNRLAKAYIELSDKFQQLDVAHMSLKQKLIPAIKALQDYQSLTTQLKQEKAQLEHRIMTLLKRQESLEEALQILEAKETELSTVVATLNEEKTALQATLQEFHVKYKALADLEALLQPSPQAVLTEAEEQMALIEETLQEISLNSDPDLSEEEQQLIEAYQNEGDSLFASEDTSTESNTVTAFDLIPIVA